MNLHAMLVTGDGSAATVLGAVLSGYGIAVDRSSDPETAMARLQQQRFDALIADFDEPEVARQVLDHARQLGSAPLCIALVADPAQVRTILREGAHFVLYKPLTEDSTRAGMRAAAALLTRERRKSFRVPVQAPVEIKLPDGKTADGILLDLSETGMDVLTAEPQVQGALLEFHFRLPDGSVEITANGQVAWASANGQTGVHFLNLPDAMQAQLKSWLMAAAASLNPSPDETVPHCKLTDLSLGGCYVQTGAPFPEGSLVDCCLKINDVEVHTEAMVRVTHPGQGMGLEFPSRTEDQRNKVLELINFLRTSPGTAPELSIAPRALRADPKEFECDPLSIEASTDAAAEDWEDPLLELLRRGASLEEEEFFSELEHQRS